MKKPLFLSVNIALVFDGLDELKILPILLLSFTSFCLSLFTPPLYVMGSGTNEQTHTHTHTAYCMYTYIGTIHINGCNVIYIEKSKFVLE